MARILRPDDFQTQIDDLARRLRAVETAPSLANSAIKEGSTVILDATGATRVRLGKDPADSTYGIKIFDKNGIPLLTNNLMRINDTVRDRVKIGNLDGAGSYGIQVFDAAGVSILDTLGLIAVIKSLGISAVFINTGGLTSTVYSGAPGPVLFTFTTTRVENLIFFFYVAGYITAGAGQIRYRTELLTSPGLVSVAASGPTKMAGTGTTAIANGFGHLYVPSLAAGTYQIQNEYQVDAGVTGFLDQAYVQGFQLGA